MSTAQKNAWELEVRPRKVRIVAAASAFVVIVGAIVGGVLARIHSTGPKLTDSDQVSIIGVGLVIAGAILLLTRARLRVDESGIRVRNVFVERRFAWTDVLGVTFPDRSPWPRLELPGDEYVPIMAIRAGDGQSAVDAIETLRALGRKYSA